MRVLPWLCWIGLMQAACGGPHFDGRLYRSDELSFRVGPQPKDWQSVRVDGALLAFRDRRVGTTVAVNGRCGLDGDDVPLGALTHHLFLHFTARQIVRQETIQMDGRAALRTELLAELDGVPRRFVVIVLKKDGCVYDFVWIAVPNAPVQATAEFQDFVRGFTTEI